MPGSRKSPPPPPPRRRLRDLLPGSRRPHDGQSQLNIEPHRHRSFRPDQLHHTLLAEYKSDNNAERQLVAAIWYGKRVESARHEFLLIEVRDRAIPALINYMVLDRNPDTQTSSGVSAYCGAGCAFDAFKISYDGDMRRLLRECGLDNHLFLECLEFPAETPLYIDELVVLAQSVSKRYPNYHLVTSNCYVFAGLIWECLRKIRPGAVYYEDGARYRGSTGRMHYKPLKAEVNSICITVQKEITEAAKTPHEEIEAARRKKERHSFSSPDSPPSPTTHEASGLRL